jgi:regulator of CtrA degradation
METPGGLAGTAFFGRTYDEACELLRQTRDWLGGPGAAAARGLEPAPALVFAHETLRLTARLTQIMAWLLAQRAAHAGEIEREELRGERWRLGARELCLAPPPEAAAGLPEALLALLRRSEQLYVRIARLDDMVGRGAA